MIKTSVAGNIAFRLEINADEIQFSVIVQMQGQLFCPPENIGIAHRPDFTGNQLFDSCGIYHRILKNLQLIKYLSK
jgi:hypothetical protein